MMNRLTTAALVYQPISSRFSKRQVRVSSSLEYRTFVVFSTLALYLTLGILTSCSVLIESVKCPLIASASSRLKVKPVRHHAGPREHSDQGQLFATPSSLSLRANKKNNPGYGGIWRDKAGCADSSLLCVRWYLRYAVRYRDLEEMMRERGLCVDHTTIYRWVQRYAPEIDKRCRPFLRRTTDSYRIDETYVRVGGAWRYLYRGVDSTGDTLDFLLRATRDREGGPRVLPQDGRCVSYDAPSAS